MNPENQAADLERRSLTLTEHPIFLEEKESTRKTRPVKEELMQACRRGEVDVILVWKLDRFARSVTELSTNLDELKKLKVRFISIRDGLDLDPKDISGVQMFQFHILSAFAELERAMIRERTIAGLDRARKNGKVLGRPRKHPK